MNRGVEWYTKGEARISVYFPEGKTDCRHCEFHRYIEAYRTYHCALTNIYIEQSELDIRPEHCPVVIERSELEPWEK